MDKSLKYLTIIVVSSLTSVSFSFILMNKNDASYYKMKSDERVKIEAIKAGLVQDERGNWVKAPVLPIPNMGYGGSAGHLTPQEVDALYHKSKDKE